MAPADNLTYQKIKELCSIIDHNLNPAEIEYIQLANLFSIPSSWLIDSTVSLKHLKRFITLKYNQALFPLSKNFDSHLVGMKLFVLRSVHRLSQEQMAALLDTSKCKIEALENGKEPYYSTLTSCMSASRILKVDLPMLFDRSLSAKEFRAYYLNRIHCSNCLNCL